MAEPQSAAFNHSAIVTVIPEGVEPIILALKGLCPDLLDDGTKLDLRLSTTTHPLIFVQRLRLFANTSIAETGIEPAYVWL